MNFPPFRIHQKVRCTQDVVRPVFDGYKEDWADSWTVLKGRLGRIEYYYNDGRFLVDWNYFTDDIARGQLHPPEDFGKFVVSDEKTVIFI